MPSRLRLITAALLLALAGCRTVIPQPAYRKVDQDAPAFKEAVAKETERQIELGKSARETRSRAVNKVKRATLKVASDRRNDSVAPLAKALEKLTRSRGCWAYTITTTKRTDGKATVDVVRFDAYQPEAKLWTLVSRDGQTPDEETQADFSRAQLRAWKRAQVQGEGRRAQDIQMWEFVDMSDLTITGPDDAGQTTFLMTRAHGQMPILGELPAAHRTYVMDEAQQVVLRQTEVFEEPSSMLGGSVKIQIWEASSDYAIIAPEVPPFPIRTKVRYRGQIFGKDSGLVEIETVYSDHRRVKCYDERFSVKLGELNVMDFVPDGK